MKKHRGGSWGVGLLVVVMFAGVVPAAVVPAWAVEGVAASATVVDQAANDRAWVRRLAGKHPLWTVRTDAWVALMSEAGDEAIAAFLASGLSEAVARASESSAVNRDFVAYTEIMTESGTPDPGQDGNELRAVTALPGGQHDRQRLLALLTSQTQLGGQPAPRPAQRVIIRLDGGPTWWLGLQIPLFRAPAAC